MMPLECASMRSIARWVLPVLVGPSTAVTPAPGARSEPNADVEEKAIFFRCFYRISRRRMDNAPWSICFNLRRLRGRSLSSGTPGERIAPESVTPVGSGFVHRNISRGSLLASLDQVCIGETSEGRGLFVLSSDARASRIRSGKESTGIQSSALSFRDRPPEFSDIIVQVGNSRRTRPGISRFPDAQLHI